VSNLGTSKIARASLGDVLQHGDFARRHIGPGEAEQQRMLDALGYETMDAFIDAALPREIRTEKPLQLPRPLTERETLERLAAYAAENRVAASLIGMGYYDTFTPPVIQRNVLENPGWYTAYTPYQAEISQGRLEALLNFQQMVMDLTGTELANASLLDEATAAAEAMAMSHRLSKTKSDLYLVAPDVHPQTLAVLRTRAAGLGIELMVADPAAALAGADCFGVLVQNPATDGRLYDLAPLAERCKAKGALLSVATDLLAAVLVEPPGKAGADIVLGSAQRFGVPLGYGGPHAAFFATRDAFKRQLPGRLIGVSVDRQGNTALRMALQTREQHIRREKATSNICTAQVLLANIAGFYAVWHGPKGLTAIARRTHRLAAALAEGLRRLGFALRHQSYFDTLAVESERSAMLVDRAREAGINLRLLDANGFAVALDETSTPALVERLLALFGAVEADAFALERAAPEAIPAALRRSSAFLTHPVFHLYRSETEMLRYLRRLQMKDIALDRAMIPLGSCTMKLNAAAEMLPLTWPGFARLHPFAPSEQAAGYRRLFEELEAWLCEITGFAAVSLQPNAGSQGEYAGLLAIKRYHESRGEGGRKVCLIPASAHGTNPASAQMAGLEVVVVATDRDGSIDLADLKAKAAEHGPRLAGLMVTYPSTHGVFERGIKEITAAVHAEGGQVYMDGANLNALVGLSRPAELGADVMHMNLHKTFCIPHGGGGPGMGPIGVAAHLVPFLPGHPVGAARHGRDGAVSAAPFGSALILTISWAYIALMGRHLRRATEVAILSANYLAKRLDPLFPVLYRGKGGRVAHECIIDLRPLKEQSGVGAEDVAKRLMDYGFHAPTLSFPVAGTLMVEPTESESLRELDRFAEAMVAIRGEIAEVARGTWPKDDNPLVMAPHTLAEVTAESWRHAYARRVAAFPLPWLKSDKYWPPVARVDNVAGDRNVVCACPPIEAYQQAAE
jgi:glycine dehydrogenase